MLSRFSKCPRRKSIKNFPKNVRVLNVKSILRDDLAAPFFHRRLQMRQRLFTPPKFALRVMTCKCRRTNRSSREDLLDEILRPNIAFHGTPHKNVASIVKFGSRLPGSNSEDLMITSSRSSIAFDGRGIYSSPETLFAVSFAGFEGAAPTNSAHLPGLRLFVCATLMGNCYIGTGVHGHLRESFDLQMTNNSFEYIVYDPAPLPSYVVSLDMSTPAATKTMREAQMKPIAFIEGQKRDCFRRRGKKELGILDPGELRRFKQEKRNAAKNVFLSVLDRARSSRSKRLVRHLTTTRTGENFRMLESGVVSTVR